MTEQVLPYNEDAEIQAVGACLVSDRARDAVVEQLEPQHLYLPWVAGVYQAILDLHDAGQAVDPLLVEQRLDPRLTGKAHELATLVSATGNAVHYASVIREHYTRRQLISAGQNITRLGWEPPDSTDDAVNEAERIISDLSLRHDPGDLEPISHSLNETYALLDTPGGIVTGTPTGIVELDRLTSGLQPGQLIVVAARPGMGKSALVTGLLIHNTVHNHKPAALFSIEMSRQEINQRCLSQVAGVDLMMIRTRNGLTAQDRDNLNLARPLLERAPIYTDDSANLRLTDIRARARRFKRKHPDLAFIAVDYLQLMVVAGGDGRHDNRNQEIAYLSRGLKVLARELEVPIVALAQLNRNVEMRHDKRPILSDLRDSGAIEQDSDVVIFLYRDDYYNPTTDRPGITELILSKHRNGPTGNVQTVWLKHRAQFANPQEHNGR